MQILAFKTVSCRIMFTITGTVSIKKSLSGCNHNITVSHNEILFKFIVLLPGTRHFIKPSILVLISRTDQNRMWWKRKVIEILSLYKNKKVETFSYFSRGDSFYNFLTRQHVSAAAGSRVLRNQLEPPVPTVVGDADIKAYLIYNPRGIEEAKLCVRCSVQKSGNLCFY